MTEKEKLERLDPHVKQWQEDSYGKEWEGFVEWHNERTVNKIESPIECECNLKDEWLKKRENK